MEEIWKDSTLEPGYQVSNLGNIRKVLGHCKYGEAKLNYHPDGYLVLCGGKTFGAIHKLVATEFCENDDLVHKKIVDHINNIHTDNRAENLEWVTQKENLRRAKLLGKSSSGARKCICVETGQVFNSISEASKKMNIRYYSIYGVMQSGRSVHGYHFKEIEEVQ